MEMAGTQTEITEVTVRDKTVTQLISPGNTQRALISFLKVMVRLWLWWEEVNK